MTQNKYEAYKYLRFRFGRLLRGHMDPDGDGYMPLMADGIIY